MGKQRLLIIAACLSTVAAAPQGTASAQDVAEEASSSGGSSIYRKKVGGIFFIEATAGPTRYNATKLADNIAGKLNLPPGVEELAPKIKVSGPEFGGALGFKLGAFTLGARMRVADYDRFKLKTAGLDMNFLIRTPYVHPYIRLGLNYNWLGGNKEALLPIIAGVSYSGLKVNGGGVTIGLGVRVPIIKYISFAAGVDVSVVAIYVRGSGTIFGVTDSYKAGALGIQTSGSFALTFHI